MGLHMKVLVSLLLIVNLSIAYASEEIFFTNKPANVTMAQAVSAVEKAAKRRKWTPTRLADNRLEVKLEHHGYRNWLIFSFSDGGIYYTDLTTYDEADDHDDTDDHWVKKAAPRRWVKNLKKDADGYLRKYARNAPTKQESSTEVIEAKLKSLKKMYDEKLISQSEYEQKKKELLSRY